MAAQRVQFVWLVPAIRTRTTVRCAPVSGDLRGDLTLLTALRAKIQFSEVTRGYS